MDITMILYEVRAKLKAAKSETLDDMLIAIDKGEVDEYERLIIYYSQLSDLSNRLESKSAELSKIVGEVVDIGEHID